MPHHLERVATFSTCEVLPFVPKTPNLRRFKVFAGHKISLSKRRYRMFATKGTCCVRCGLKGTFFALERHKGAQETGRKKYHLNLYAITGNGEEVMLTMDHILPRSKGGSNKMHNLQPMCDPCNVKKADKPPQGQPQANNPESSSCPKHSTTPINSVPSTTKSSSSNEPGSSSSPDSS